MDAVNGEIRVGGADGGAGITFGEADETCVGEGPRDVFVVPPRGADAISFGFDGHWEAQDAVVDPVEELLLGGSEFAEEVEGLRDGGFAG